ncbi:MAG: hypothetical protein P0119_10760 [Nitrospira sp.]|nr:hypothetical protein [Nitrospira sp.]
MILVLDASPSIALARISSLGLLHQLADQIVIPDAVYAESVSPAPGRPRSLEIAQTDWITRWSVDNRTHVQQLRTRIGLGEAEAWSLVKRGAHRYLCNGRLRNRCLS